jgi:hypothetical protein
VIIRVMPSLDKARRLGNKIEMVAVELEETNDCLPPPPVLRFASPKAYPSRTRSEPGVNW